MTEPSAFHLPKILVIDDEPDICAYLTALLEDNGFEAVSTTDGDAGVALARKDPPALICLDIMMPKRTGIALYEDLKRDPATRNTPVVFISAFNQLQDLQLPQYFRKMVGQSIPEPEAYFEKPIRPRDFVDTVTAIIGASVIGESGNERQ
jgi:CheY-like chemotaxis protein